MDSLPTATRFSAARRVFLGSAAAAAIASNAAWAQDSPPEAPRLFGFEDGVEAARARAAEAYEQREQELEPPFADLSYDAYRAIRVLPERRLWRDESRGFVVDLLPPGSIYRDAVRIHVVEDGVPREIGFDPTMLRFDPPYFEKVAPTESGQRWTGFRLRHPLNRPEELDEVAVFQGASYFRAVARDQIYGLSARALAIRTGAPEGEEFPRFTDFWLHRPEVNANAITVQALVDSPSLAAAFEFVVRPGAETTMDVRSVLIPREDVAELGLAPLTSMYYFGPKDRSNVRDYRDAVHDSAGLQMVSGTGERIWRPLSNPAALQLSTFIDSNPRGFGLAQRQRAFDYYQDAEARYDRRPSAWIAPNGDWGLGGVRLVEIPTQSEFNDNIVSFWRPETGLTGRTERAFDYRITWAPLPPDATPAARVLATRIGRAVNEPEALTVAVDWDLGDLRIDDLSPDVSLSQGEVRGAAMIRLPGDARGRLSMTFFPPDAGDVEFRVVLRGTDGAPASETWLYRWTPS